MNQSLRPILPATADQGRSAAGRDDRVYAFWQPEKKKRRKHVLVACNNCRRNKVACDANRPSCARCIRLDIVCEYVSKDETETPNQVLRNQISLLQQKLQEHADILHQLTTAPEGEALNTLRQLRESSGSRFALGWTFIDLPQMTGPPGELTDSRLLSFDDSSVEIELNLFHHTLYPRIEPIDTSLIDIPALLQAAPRGALTRGSKPPESPVREDTVVLSVIPGAMARRTGNSASVSGPATMSRYLDEKLRRLKMGYWTKVPVSDEFAANAISLFLETEHPILGLFDAELVINDLVEQEINYCSPFLACALMCLTCQTYASVDDRATSISRAFFREGETLWLAEVKYTCPSTLAAMMLFGLSCMFNGEEELMLDVFTKVCDAAAQMHLFGVPQTDKSMDAFCRMPSDRIRESSHVAWGAFNVLTIYNVYCHKEGIPFHPVLPIPGELRTSNQANSFDWPPHPLPSYMGQTFTSMCKLWTIAGEIATVYYSGDHVPHPGKVSFAFAEEKYRNLLAWAGTFSTDMACGEHSPAHVLVFHGLIHALILDVFRPFVLSDDKYKLQSLLIRGSPGQIFCSSLNQLKRILLMYMSQLQPTLYSAMFNTAILHIINATVQEEANHDWSFYFFLCMTYLKEIYRRHPVYGNTVRAYLTMALQKGIITSKEARELSDQVLKTGRHHEKTEEAVSSWIVDLDLSMTCPTEAQLQRMAEKFDTMIFFNDLIHESDLGKT